MPQDPSTNPPALPRRSASAFRIMIYCVAFCVCGLMIIPGTYLWIKYQGWKAWRVYEAGAKQRGVKFDFAEFLPPKVPDAENFAAIPIFKAVFLASDKGEKIPNPFELPRPKTGVPPKLSQPIKGTRIDLAAWQVFFVETQLLPSASDNAAADVLKAVDHFAAPLTELRAGTARPHCSFPVHWEQNWNAALPHLKLLQDASVLHALRMAAYLASGQSEAAYGDFHDGLRLATAIEREPAFLDGLVRTSILSVMLNAVWDGLAGHQWSEPELRRIETDLSALDWLKDLQFVLASERAATGPIFESLVSDPRMLAKVVEDSKMGPVGKEDPGNADHWRYLLYPAGWHYQSRVRLNRFYDELLARTDPTQHRWFGDRRPPSAPENARTSEVKVKNLVFMLVAPAIELVEHRHIQEATVIDEARLACALERFRLKRGSFPKSLAELTPDFLPRMSVEIVNGEPYHYRRTDDGNFVLYSVGTDLVDDGGAIDPRHGATSQKDWVWRYPEK